MAKFTVRELVGKLRECAGQDEAVDLDGDIVDVPFSDLGYDSLALFNTVGSIERDYAISLSDDAVTKAGTPQLLLDMINDQLAHPS